jgi:hypothetical protein
MDEVNGVGDGIEHDTGAAENAGPLTDCAGKTVLIAFKLKGCFSFAVNLAFSFF